MLLSNHMRPVTRRGFLKTTLAAGLCPAISLQAAGEQILGQGDFRYRVVPKWGILSPDTPVSNCHGLVRNQEGHIILLTDHTKNNAIVYDTSGRLVHKWGTQFPGAHGLSIVQEGKRELLFITDLQRHKVFKTTLTGEILSEWGWPADSGKYSKETEYRPSWTLHLPGGDFFVLDGYGKDYISRYNQEGKLLKVFGGPEGGITHWGPHGGMVNGKAASPELLVAMSDQQYLLRLSLDGKKLGQISMPGGNPRQIRSHKGNYYVAHLADNWPKDRNSRGFISILDKDLQVLSNVAGTCPIYDDSGKLQPMKHQEEVFVHPHDLVVDDEGSIYVAQFASNNTYPVKLERV